MTPDSEKWLAQHPDILSLRLAVCDINGQARGKRIPVGHAEKALKSGARMPLSALNMDIWGEDIAGSPLVFESGDGDGVLTPTGRGLLPMPWLGAPAALLPLWMFHDDGTACDGDPRQALARVLDRYAALGYRPVVATELEFYLVDPTGEMPALPTSPLTGKRLNNVDILSLDAIDAFDGFFSDLYAAAAAMDIPADAAISEGGTGQYEINLLHGDDAMKAADDAWLFKMAVRGIARKHGMAATFMAKPFADHGGNGMHMHFSVLDANGKNIFDDGTDLGSAVMRHGVGGLLAAMQASALIFAPHKNSYQRLTPNAHAPTGVNWGYENRTAAIRIPGGASQARRIEHRVAGGDTNPYLVLAVVLGAALNGIEQQREPMSATAGNAYDQKTAQLPGSWAEAIDLFASSPLIADIFTPMLIENLVACKRQELRLLTDASMETEFAAYLETV